MGRLDRAPADPLFWLHHANVDAYLVAVAQQSPQGQRQYPSLAGRDAIMDPWRFTEPDTRDIATFNYGYM